MSNQDDPQTWFVAEGERFTGPLTALEVVQRVQAGTLSFAHYGCPLGGVVWKRLCEWDAFISEAPEPPSHELKRQVNEVTQVAVVRTAARRSTGFTDRPWFLHYAGAQFGPYSVEEIARLVRIGRIRGRAYAWRDGMPTWERLEKVEGLRSILALDEADLAGAVAPALVASEAEQNDAPAVSMSRTQSEVHAEQRQFPRRPLVARIVMTEADTGEVALGLCRDVSVGGMQILTEHRPAGAGSRIRINVSPSGGETSPTIPAFVAEGEVVRLLEEGRGFSFRFENLSAEAKSSIEKFVTLSEGSGE
jgi:hypothetical protein